MFLRIEKGSAAPISRQIAHQIASLCAAGKLKPGERLPSVRELARDLGVNQNTILRVYERLSGDGLLEMRQGQGTFVADGARANASPGQRTRLLDELRQIARQAQSLGLSSEQIHELLSVALGELDEQAAHDLAGNLS
ncbi:GntR family transcriptional regulator [Lacipirellula limnantheis]|jgi:GntR family transcriptional regulator|uniref:HTH-type transcriptional repressor YtrA n=1 Tax=Lacipirellula limnantheis TaxID=2528024 RepID=A0A517TUT1_9BACT|nr:GntR family transcriptional regulator [Lacipirellula limnantheis]QDT72130.1 HTH-type transcriptional repressor YtrA [Lacipirellula limnantheis]